MVERKVDWELILVALILTLTILGGIYFTGKALSDSKVENLQSSLEEFSLERSSQELSWRLAQNLERNQCDALRATTRQNIQDIRDLRVAMNTYEDSAKIKNDRFILTKKRYTNLLIEYWLTTDRIEEQCGSEVVEILYFYEENGCGRCEDQGTILTKYRQEFRNNLLVFPLDSSLDLRTVELLEDTYGIESFPSMVVEGEVYHGFRNYEETGDIIESHLNGTSAPDSNFTGS